MSTASLRGREGLIFVKLHVTDPELKDDVFHRWCDQVHLPEFRNLVAAELSKRDGGGGTEENVKDKEISSIVKNIVEWQTADDTARFRYTGTFWLADLDAVLELPLRDLTVAHEMLPGGKSILELTEVYIGFYELVERFESNDTKAAREHQQQVHVNNHDNQGFGVRMISAGMDPKDDAAEDDMNKWYREEHNKQMSLEPGWVRSTRYKLFRQFRFRPEHADVPKWLTLHEFDDGNKLGEKVAPLEPVTDWTRKVIGEMAKIDTQVWRRISVQ